VRTGGLNKKITPRQEVEGGYGERVRQWKPWEGGQGAGFRFKV